MQKWMRKALVVTFSILTFGMITPPLALTMDENNPDQSSKLDAVDQQSREKSLYALDEIHNETESESFLSYAIANAEKQSFEKFGNKIGPIIEDEFRNEILPKIELAISTVAAQYPAEQLNELEITEQPAGGNGEKIFHIFHRESGEDIIRFHVRKDHPPQDGYWFNFHYHTYHDGFQAHHTLGEIYWDKNTPPRWMS
ncbi:YpjP family protein [Fredinandcohnia quinoae]|uniref:YpjP family protein n=1 Tax=Fredinandcohnia quinoae TaxID=2918902 RepID=A0AAW5EAE0_9BACI|nr:YpjP family protein [Fredinandcohnia sp. SECRCQ15]MCH1626381.1 YpjP family protein [Fredinandcohnia sp. SECRCQ15]